MKKLLVNPFERFAGFTSLVIGCVVILITSAIALAGNIHLDGVIDLHISKEISVATCLKEGAINWLSMVVFIYIAGLIFSRSSIRFIDVLGTQALARFPMIIACLGSWLLDTDVIQKFIQYKLKQSGEPVTVGISDWLMFGLSTLLMLLSVVWMIALMYKAYSVSCNIKGTRGVVSFIACILLAEITSKLLLFFL